jgi:hypothetical protein
MGLRKNGTVEILERNKQLLPGLFFTLCFEPPPPEHPPIAIILTRLMKTLTNEGARGCSPWVPPSVGGERVTLLAAAKE